MAGYPVTPRAAQVAVEEASERSYGQAVEHLARSHGVRMGKELLENLTQTVGEYWLAQDRQEVVSAKSLRTAPAEQCMAEESATGGSSVVGRMIWLLGRPDADSVAESPEKPPPSCGHTLLTHCRQKTLDFSRVCGDKAPIWMFQVRAQCVFYR